MSGNNEYIRQLAEASRDMEGASLTIGARIDDDLADTVRETMRLPQFANGAKASDLSIAIFGDAGNSHVLAVDTRLLLMRDAGEVTWERGLFRFVETIEEDDDDEDGTYYMIVRIRSEIVAVELEDTGDEPDVWRDLDAFDRREGTGLYDMLFEANVLDVVSDLGDSPHTPSIIVRNASDVEALLDEEDE